MSGSSRQIVEGEIGGFPVPWKWRDDRSRRSGGRRRWWRRGSGASRIAFNLVAVRTADLKRARRFYEAVGLEFVEEQHGDGPVHLAASLPSGVVMELYPASDDSLPDRGSVGDVRLGFVVDDLDAVLHAFEEVDGTVVSDPSLAGDQRRAVVTDPDGRRVELIGRGDVVGPDGPSSTVLSPSVR